MPIVKVWGLTETAVWTRVLTGTIREGLAQAIAGVEPLEIRADQVTVIFPKSETAISDVIVEIGRLFPRPRRTAAVKAQLAATVCAFLKSELLSRGNEKDQQRKIEVFVDEFSPDNGYYSSDE